MRECGAALATLLLLPAAAGHAETGRRSPSDFHRIAEIEAVEGIAAGQPYSLPLTREAISTLERGGELRVFAADGHEIPSLVHTAHAREAAVKHPASIFNRAFEPGGVQTLSIEIEDRTIQSVNEFTFELEDEQVNARVRVEGRDPSGEWRVIRDDLRLIRHTVRAEKIAYIHNVLRIPTARFRSYRFTIAEPDREEPLAIKRVLVRKVEPRGASTHVPVRVERWQNPRDTDPRHQYWQLHLALPDLGVNRVYLTLDGTDFARSASLFEWNPQLGREGALLARMVVFRYGKDAQDADTDFEGFSTDADVLVLRIDQGDDVPVPLVRARASRPSQQLRFLTRGPVALPLRLYFLPDEARDPEYDLDRSLRERGITDFTALVHRPLVDNPDYAEPPPPMSERVPYLLTVLVIALLAGIGLYIARTVRAGLPPEQPEPDPAPDADPDA